MYSKSISTVKTKTVGNLKVSVIKHAKLFSRPDFFIDVSHVETNKILLCLRAPLKKINLAYNNIQPNFETTREIYKNN